MADFVGPSVTYGGYKLPSFPRMFETVSALQTFKPATKDIMLCSYPKSGSHWMFEILNMLLNGSTEYTAVPITNIESNPDLLTPHQEPRILHSHLPCHLLPGYFLTKSKIVYVMRNPKDQFVSMYHMYTSFRWSKERSFSDFFEQIMSDKDQVEYGFWTSNALEWWFTHGSNPNILFVFYEDMIQDLVREVGRVNEFFGFNRDSRFVEAVASKTRFKTMKSEKPKLSWYSRCKDNFHILRQGQTNCWYNYFTTEQSIVFDKVLRTEYAHLAAKHSIHKTPPYLNQLIFNQDSPAKNLGESSGRSS